MATVTLKNPHSILAVLDTRPAEVIEVQLPQSRGGKAWDAVREQAAAADVPIVRSESGARRQRGRRGSQTAKAGREGGGRAEIREPQPCDLHALFAGAEDATHPGLWLALDCIQDPHNVGAIFRSAAFFGVAGILMTADRSAPLSSVACDTAAGGVEYVPFALETNLSRSLEAAKQAGVWVLGTSEHAELEVQQIERDRSWLLVIGNEGQGLRRLTEEHCDAVCRISPRGRVTSLNASVAAGILIATLSGVAPASHPLA